jgi:hypothetical protein
MCRCHARGNCRSVRALSAALRSRADHYTDGGTVSQQPMPVNPRGGSCAQALTHDTLLTTEPVCLLLQDIITKCWDAEPSARPSFEKVLDLLKDAAKALGSPA